MLVDFADESHFSRLAMYLRGRVWLEGKTSVLQLCDESMVPKTYIIERGQWSGDSPPPDDQVGDLPWFVKEADRNWGSSVECCLTASAYLGLAEPEGLLGQREQPGKCPRLCTPHRFAAS